ncbi:MAG: class II aldolase/adducin family protein [Pirellulales bacterium]|nr:class II aldolase/adducin family protein [Pirellulales bacterium]
MMGPSIPTGEAGFRQEKLMATSTETNRSTTTGQSDAAQTEWDLRVQLAAAYRIFEHLGWCELIYAHISVRVPGPDHHFLINPYGLRYDEVTASNLVKIDVDGNLVEPTEYTFNPAGFTIHSAVHMYRESAACVMHTHTRAGMAVAALECGLLPISMNATSFYHNLAYHEYEGSTILCEEREKLVADLGDANAMILRNHGLLTVGQTIPETFLYLHRLERACQVQLDALACGRPLVTPSQEVIERSAAQMVEFDRHVLDVGQLEFNALVRLLDAKDPSFRE